jgi:choline dehydrogenase
VKTTVEGVRISREVLSQSALSRYTRKEHFPGPNVKTVADLEAYARQYGRTSYHPVGTCRMGGDAASVVDPQLRVRGVDSLRICDSSIMPRVVSSNTNAPTIMIAEKASKIILGNA